MYSYLLIYILLKRPGQLEITFSIFSQNVFSVFLAKSTLTICNITVARRQILMTPDFAVIKYKIQGVTFQIAVFNLYRNIKSGNKSLYKRFCSIYV